ncbi:flagellar protein FlgN [Thermosediminibacter litoriperuensis]|uniref:Flagellar biosynthesis/type III secretory pathway chaperone n=1 Tax=Thermosediminibacter litoriperuensis TaxID=291989 RepID=A0A5S5AJ48_9FIRM|nr:flagellar protein FlgN [Thermosediminibacter litoriperuensis]TYP50913.1 flagellar biosynthesis/type III secretory pathway chaperone [Thermosediminibacter litoriperuensis]
MDYLGVANELIKNIKKQVEIYKELLGLSQKKTDILVMGDVKTLGEITDLEQELIVRLGRIEDERMKIVAGIAGEEITVSRLAEKLPEDIKLELERISGELKEVLSKLRDRNEINEKLIRRALEYINYSLEIMAGAGKQSTGYSADGKTAEKETIRLIDKRA